MVSEKQQAESDRVRPDSCNSSVTGSQSRFHANWSGICVTAAPCVTWPSFALCRAGLFASLCNIPHVGRWHDDVGDEHDTLSEIRAIPFCPPSLWATGDQGEPSERPGTFDLLGFTHFWGRSQRGYWIVKWKTASDRFSRAVRSIDSWCQANRHISIGEQQQKLNEKLRGHYAYYGVTGNSAALSRFLWEVERRWRKWL